MLNAEVVADSIQGEYDAVRDANPNEDDAEWNGADQMAEELRTDPSVGFVFTADLRSATKWTYTRVETDVPADVADDDIRSAALDEALAAAPSMAPAVLLEASKPDGVVADDDAEGAEDAAAAVDDAEAAEGSEMVEETGHPLPDAVTQAPVVAAAKEPVAVPPAVPSAAEPSKQPLRCFLL
jgi:hypothetical protein